MKNQRAPRASVHRRGGLQAQQHESKSTRQTSISGGTTPLAAPQNVREMHMVNPLLAPLRINDVRIRKESGESGVELPSTAPIPFWCGHPGEGGSCTDARREAPGEGLAQSDSWSSSTTLVPCSGRDSQDHDSAR
jgi:hypothetical protein